MSTGEYTIGRLAELSQTKAVTIRYYEREGLIRNPPRSPAGYRRYDDSDRDRLLFIRRSRQLGFSLSGVRELLALADQADAPCAHVDSIVMQHLRAVRERLAQLRALEKELKRLGDCCHGGELIRDCRIIDSLSGNPAAAESTVR